ncbi:MAG: 1-acyl-sn-glycerol-3-phosphate acyltransferase [Casimicrobiaceae bacterium]|nr:1-acyl-sn-glycerol-3-phosphate acyltransferase [Casimicrobiaceae bacterium]MCX8098506.1 1-acyl-sn-glycerol-3-phosphate acyltransferase [Casimicrobiaceae bacterium]MDW8311609.1 lysophospholipid acyltransferase family protein [Burkholderiales bacterium]
MKQALANTAFLALQALVTPIYALFVCACFWLPAKARYSLCVGYVRLFLWLAERLCGIRSEIRGLENIPTEPCVVLAKHSSTWETFMLARQFAPAAFVAKRELLWVPFFGWAFALASPITIDRQAGSQAMTKMIAQGRRRLADGYSIVVFPEGTRIAAGKRGKYKTGGVRLAQGCGVPILPVAHNAGWCWPRHPWRKYAGTITLSILPPVPSQGRDVIELNAEIEALIEAEVERLGNGRRDSSTGKASS